MKTEQQKVQEIVDSHKKLVNGYVSSSLLTDPIYQEIILDTAKEAAKHTVRDILKGLRMMEGKDKNFSESIIFFSGVHMRIDLCN